MIDWDDVRNFLTVAHRAPTHRPLEERLGAHMLEKLPSD
jgi:hypothetical protein